MKIGIEYEGVILKDGKPLRWSSICKKDRKEICNAVSDKNPVDAYDCLAEIRFLSTSVDSRTILQTLMEKINTYNGVFLKRGFNILWGEMEIPEEIHKEIVGEKDKAKEKFKPTSTVSSNGVTGWSPEGGNRFRGGGMHINVSPISQLLAPALVLSLHESLRHHSEQTMKSNYRHHILFRQRMIENESVTEYMTFGLTIPKINSTDAAFKMIAHNFHWADCVVNVVKEFGKEFKLG